ncbi:MAG: SMC-Scp complex subunit ScpB [Cephaloticoccus sp.]
MAFNLKKVLRALLFSSNQPLAIKDIQAAFTRFHEAPASAPADNAEVALTPDAPAAEEAEETAPDESQDLDLYGEVPALITSAQIREAMDELAAELRAADDSLLLIEGSSGYRLVTHPRFARWVRVLRNEPPPVRLSRSALETLAIVAYRQPVTRAEIETIRGVSADAGLNKLIERDLIYIVGRADLPGRPIQYGTTDQFLEFTGVKSLDELPASDVLSNRQIDDWLQTAKNPGQPPADAEMGLPLEEGEGETPNLEEVSVEHHEEAPAESGENKTA